jgi:hypothetical protein
MTFMSNKGNNKITASYTNLQNTTHKTKDRVTRAPLNTGGEQRSSGRVGSSCSTSGTRLSL